MIDTFSLALSHALLALAAWRLLRRRDLDREALPGALPPARPGSGARPGA